MERNYKVECLETKLHIYLTEIDMDRIVTMSSRYNKGVYGKLRPFFKFQDVKND